MKCTRCQRELAPELSMCVSCGAMRDDSVREELESSLTPIAAPVRFHFVEDRADAVPFPASAAAGPVPVQEADEPAAPEAKPERPFQTSDVGSKKTSPTLAEFINKNAKIPDWRLQLQNSVRQRSGRRTVDAVSTNAVAGSPRQAPTSGANALKLDYAETPKSSPEPDTKLTNALKRIEASRRAYLPSEKAREGIRVAKEASRKFPYSVVSRSEDLPDLPVKKTAAEPSMAVRPKLVSSLKIEKKEYDTNKLVPIPEAAKMASSFDEAEIPAEAKPRLKDNWSQKIEIRDNRADEEAKIPELPFVEDAEPESGDIDDLAPIAMRFNAGLFDLIIGGFATFALLSPFFAFSEGWFS
ncbi:MAG: hypothetical protein HOP17_09005, partial [Acidobacteria bacterium]|nr:hypothetical protein [Acidobacteriota bacterium]